MDLLKQEYAIRIACGELEAHFFDNKQALRCLEILAVTLQALEPSPKPLSCLQQVQLIRTAVRNDPSFDFENSTIDDFRTRMFPGHKGIDMSAIHFLLNNRMTRRNRNKLLAGAKLLITTDTTFDVKELGSCLPLLDVLVHWELKIFMGPFIQTHLSNLGQMSRESLQAIMEITHEAIEKRNFTLRPFNHSAYKLHVIGSPRSKKQSLKSKSSKKHKVDSPKKRKATENVSDQGEIVQSTAHSVPKVQARKKSRLFAHS